MNITNTIDWYSVTLEPENQGYVQKVVVLGDRIKKPTRKPQFGYDEIAQFDGGAVLMWNSARKEMGTHLIMSGTALRYADKHGQSCEEVLSACNRLGGRCSRIDLAIDVYDTEWKLKDFSEDNRLPYEGKGRTPKFVPMGTEKAGWTVYVGSRESEKFLRIYHKGKQLGDDTLDCVRIEVECKGITAHWLGSELADKSTKEVYDVCATIVKGMVRFDDYRWNEALQAESVVLGIPKKHGKDTLGWLVKSCAPALARAIAEKPSEDIMGQFWDALQSRLKEYDLEIN